MTSSLAVESELVFAVVRPLGIDGARVVDVMVEALSRFGYSVDVVRLSALVGGATSPHPTEDERIAALIDAGNAYCEQRRDAAAIALLGIRETSALRARRRAGPEGRRRAFVIDSVKRPEEINLLRAVYARRLFVVSVDARPGEREAELVRRFAAGRPAPDRQRLTAVARALMDRDDAEPGPYGQAVGKAFPMADLFLDASAGRRLAGYDGIDQQFNRFLDLLFDNPTYDPPTVHEFAMHLADVAATRSTALGRKVGAAIIKGGSVVSLGYNDVPSATDTDSVLGYDTSLADLTDLVARTLRTLAERGLLSEAAAASATADPAGFAAEHLTGLPLRDLIEFQRPVHAEMRAIMDAARRGVSLDGCSLYVTSFPCHLCARHLVEASLEPVVYLEPYPRSRAQAMYRQPVSSSFVPFVGIAPRAYARVFTTIEDRKLPDGTLRPWHPPSARPKGDEPTDLALVLDRESSALATLDGPPPSPPVP